MSCTRGLGRKTMNGITIEVVVDLTGSDSEMKPLPDGPPATVKAEDGEPSNIDHEDVDIDKLVECLVEVEQELEWLEEMYEEMMTKWVSKFDEG